MKIVAFDMRTAGSRPYSNAIVDLAAVVMEDGEVQDEFHCHLAINDYLDYRIAVVRACEVPQDDRRSALPYHDGIGDFCAWIDEARGPLPMWAFDAKDKAAFVQNSLKYSKMPHEFARVVDACGLYATMMAVGAVPPVPLQMEFILHRLEIAAPEPRADALARAKTCATAVAMLEEELRRFYVSPPTHADSLASLPAPSAAPPVDFDPFAEDVPPPDEGDPDRFRKAFFATLGEKGLKYEGHDAKVAVRSFLAESPLLKEAKVESASKLTPDIFAERLGPLGRWKDGEIEIPVLDAFLAQQGDLFAAEWTAGRVA